MNLLRRAQCLPRPPGWLQRNRQDLLWEQINWQTDLVRSGQIIWGALVQANAQLFDPGLIDCPAAFAISFDPGADAYPVRLEALAKQVFELKDTEPDAGALATLARSISNEMERRPTAVPDGICGLADSHVASVLIFRTHLPLARISGGLFPLLTLPARTPALMVLPCRYWDERLVAAHRTGAWTA